MNTQNFGFYLASSWSMGRVAPPAPPKHTPDIGNLDSSKFWLRREVDPTCGDPYLTVTVNFQVYLLPTCAVDPPTCAVDPPTCAVDPPTCAVDPPTCAVDPPTCAVDPPALQSLGIRKSGKFYQYETEVKQQINESDTQQMARHLVLNVLLNKGLYMAGELRLNVQGLPRWWCVLVVMAASVPVIEVKAHGNW